MGGGVKTGKGRQEEKDMNRKGWKWWRFAQSHARPTAHFVGETRKCLSSRFDARSIMA